MAEFLGKVTGLITTTSLCSLAGVSNGTNLSTGDIEWLKFKSNNKEILVSSRNIKNYISWDYLNSLECVNGKVITINNKKYICRLLTGRNANPSSTAGGEWDELLVNLASSHVYYKYEYSWCIESHTDSNNAVVRGSSSLSNYGVMSKTTSSTNACWRPVLEEYIPTPTKLPQSSSLKEAVSNVSSILNLLEYNTSKLADNLTDKGVEANSEDKMSSLISKIGDIEVTKVYSAGTNWIINFNAGYDYISNRTRGSSFTKILEIPCNFKGSIRFNSHGKYRTNWGYIKIELINNLNSVKSTKEFEISSSSDVSYNYDIVNIEAGDKIRISSRSNNAGDFFFDAMWIKFGIS